MARGDFITVSGQGLLELYDRRGGKDGGVLSDRPLTVDLTDPTVYDAVVLAVEPHEDNALFYQLERVLEADGIPAGDAGSHLIFVDFSGVSAFRYHQVSKGKETAGDRAARISETRVRDLFRQGLAVRFPGMPEDIRFAAFDKSSSMARNSRISFIDEAIRDDRPDRAGLNTRLMLGMDFHGTGVQVVLSKFYAYRGLYFSDATRIDPGSLALNQETVLVMADDEKPHSKAVSIVDAVESAPDSNLWRAFRNDIPARSGSFRLNHFDGEGLISPAFAERINRGLSGGQACAASFQIRLPFGKGMLHTVDFSRFVREEVGVPAGTEVEIRDCFGIVRDFSKVQIILTESMFKCAGWLRSYCRRQGIPDPVAYYFSQFETYDHALYVSNVDTFLRNTGTTKLNYQFLHTLALTRTELEALTEAHFERCEAEAHRRVGGDVDSRDAERGEEHLERPEAAWQTVLREDPRFYRDIRVQRMVRSAGESLRRDTVEGRLLVEGECRFLSRDLGALLVYVSERLRTQISGQEVCLLGSQDDWKQRIAGLRRKCLGHNRFFMPQARIPGLKAGQYCALLRSPHLSRNEECVMQAGYCSGFYRKYLSHLKGVVMVNYDSLVPMALSGADFDGDLVKIITDSRVVNAIMKGAYAWQPEGYYARALPEINIPAKKAQSRTAPAGGAVDYETIHNTFANRVGYISNLAIGFGKETYARREKTGPDGWDSQALGALPDTVEASGLPAVRKLLGRLGEPPEHLRAELDRVIAGRNQGRGIRIQTPEAAGLPAGKWAKSYRILREYVEYPDPCAVCTILVGLEIDACKNGCHPDLREIEAAISDSGTDFYLSAVEKFRALPAFQRGWRTSVLPGGGFAIRQGYRGKDYLTVSGEAENNLDLLPWLYLRQMQSGRTPEEPAVAVRELLGIDGAADRTDLDKLGKVRQIVEAYYAVERRVRQDSKAAAAYARARFAGRIHRILSLQYDSPLDEMGKYYLELCESQRKMTVHSILTAAYGFVEAQLPGPAAMDCLRRLIAENWQLTPEQERSSRLRALLGGTPDGAVTELLTNFSASGYMLLYYIVKDMAWRPGQAEPPVAQEQEEQSAGAYRERYLTAYQTAKNRKQTGQSWRRALVEQCRRDLMDLFSGDREQAMDQALEYVCRLPKSVDRDERFFWEVFTAREISRNIRPEPPERQEADHAG